MGAAADLVMVQKQEESRRLARLRDRLENGLLASIPYAWVNGLGADRTPNTTNMNVSLYRGRVHGHRTRFERNLPAPRELPRSSGVVEPSPHVLTAIGLAPEDARATLLAQRGAPKQRKRKSHLALEAIPAVIERLRQISPTYKKSNKRLSRCLTI